MAMCASGRGLTYGAERVPSSTGNPACYFWASIVPRKREVIRIPFDVDWRSSTFPPGASAYLSPKGNAFIYQATEASQVFRYFKLSTQNIKIPHFGNIRQLSQFPRLVTSTLRQEYKTKHSAQRRKLSHYNCTMQPYGL
jgi:hypothetical protein